MKSEERQIKEMQSCKKPSGYEFVVRVGDCDWNVTTPCSHFYLQQSSREVHRHCCTEIHMVAEGVIGYQVGEKYYTVNAGEMLIIPAMIFHANYILEGEMKALVVRTDRTFEQPAIYNILPGMVEALYGEFQRAEQNGNCARVREHLALILSAAASDSGVLRPVRDKKLIIEEFFANNYDKEVSLSDLAEELELSNVQTERQIAKYMGTTFRKAIAEKRIEAAKHILATEKISLAEVAERVGYHSYCGFWKAFHGHKQERKSDARTLENGK